MAHRNVSDGGFLRTVSLYQRLVHGADDSGSLAPDIKLEEKKNQNHS